MSGVDRIRRPGYRAFPVIRRSPDPLQPESGVAEFAQALDDLAEERVTQVQEAEEVLQNRIADQEKSQERSFKKNNPKEEEEEESPEQEEDSLVNLVI
jgi:hypothetical protein